jgi:hypothetical protein
LKTNVKIVVMEAKRAVKQWARDGVDYISPQVPQAVVICFGNANVGKVAYACKSS